MKDVEKVEEITSEKNIPQKGNNITTEKRNLGILDRYIYYIGLSGLYYVIKIGIWDHRIFGNDWIKVGVLLLSHPGVINKFYQTKIGMVIYDRYWKYLEKILRRLICVTFSSLINRICLKVLGENPELSRKEISNRFKESSSVEVEMFIRIIIITQILKTIDQKIRNVNRGFFPKSFSKSVLRTAYNRNTDLNTQYRDPYPEIKDEIEKIRMIIRHRRFELFFNPYILGILEKVYCQTTDQTIWDQFMEYFSYLGILSSKMLSLYTAGTLFPLSLFILAPLLIPIDNWNTFIRFCFYQFKILKDTIEISHRLSFKTGIKYFKHGISDFQNSKNTNLFKNSKDPKKLNELSEKSKKSEKSGKSKKSEKSEKSESFLDFSILSSPKFTSSLTPYIRIFSLIGLFLYQFPFYSSLVLQYSELLDNSITIWISYQLGKKLTKYVYLLIPDHLETLILERTFPHVHRYLIAKKDLPIDSSYPSHLYIYYTTLSILGLKYGLKYGLTDLNLISDSINIPPLILMIGLFLSPLIRHYYIWLYFIIFGIFSNYHIAHILILTFFIYLPITLFRYHYRPDNILRPSLIDSYIHFDPKK